MSEPITFVCITQNRAQNLKKNLPIILPHVDRAVIIDGGSEDETEEYLRSLAPKVKYVYRKWDDSFSNQYNEYLNHVSEGWILICDDDELPSEAMLKSLRPLVEESNKGEKFCLVSFSAIAQDPDSGWESGPTGYTREVFFRWTPNLRYIRDPHQSLIGYQNGNRRVRQEVYYHYKNQRQNFYNGCRNYWIAGAWLTEHAQSGAKGPDWEELKAVVAQCYPEVTVFRELHKYMEAGNIAQGLKDWMIKYKDHPDVRYHELRLWYEYYFDHLHPEEK